MMIRKGDHVLWSNCLWEVVQTYDWSSIGPWRRGGPDGVCLLRVAGDYYTDLIRVDHRVNSCDVKKVSDLESLAWAAKL